MAFLILLILEKMLLRKEQSISLLAREKANILIGLSIAVNNIDAVIDLIKKSKTPAESKITIYKMDS